MGDLRSIPVRGQETRAQQEVVRGQKTRAQQDLQMTRARQDLQMTRAQQGGQETRALRHFRTQQNFPALQGMPADPQQR